MNQRKNNRIVLWIVLFRALAGLAVFARTQTSNPVTDMVSPLQKHNQALNKKDLDTPMSLYATGNTTVLMGVGPGDSRSLANAFFNSNGKL